MQAEGWMELEQIIEAMVPPPGKPRLGGHSPTYEGLWAFYDRLVGHLDPPRRPDWQDMAVRLGAKGFVDVEGKPPSGELVRKTWWKVRRDKQRQAEGTTRRPRGRPPVKAPAPVQAAPAVPGVAAPTDDGLTFAGGPRKWKGSEG